MKRIALLFFFAMNAKAEFNAYVFGSLGEAPFRHAYDINESAIVPQAGLQLEYRNIYATPYLKTSIGRYNHGPLFEGYLGIQLGVDIQWIRPSLLFGAGVQSTNFKTFPGFESDAYKLERKLYTPVGVGFRVEVAQTVYAELDSRFTGYPWWRFELGYRIRSFGQAPKTSSGKN